jgi:Na+-transporting NADH:ubiquinone oxidoreductase subunit NqrB
VPSDRPYGSIITPLHTFCITHAFGGISGSGGIWIIGFITIMTCPQAILSYTRTTVALFLQACSCSLLQLIVLFCFGILTFKEVRSEQVTTTLFVRCLCSVLIMPEPSVKNWNDLSVSYPAIG